MTMFRCYSEINDNEGETWDFWLQVDGNEAALEKLGNLLATAAVDGYDCYGLADVEVDEVGVDLLVAHAHVGYMASAHKVTGILSVPDSFEVDGLYKGGITELFTEQQ
ncbi:hypothetical protein IU449_27090 [Nocardia higoensis]|uniref:Uncharacterized protein n=1 Tax=Nocardia higoensis TaxID=228599 RepID=A0ABS0DI77_9NOCA|nr:hypothetical protein [Nocardia higoensis]MBF6358167.1 hypothetical protein [Nocardia higoensis]